MNQTTMAPAALSLERLKALSDGVFAIVITILVLELDVPENYDFSKDGIYTFLAIIEHQLLPYLVSFTLTAGYWVLHHIMLGYLSKCDRTFLWLNLLFMLPLSLAPFVTDMRAEYPGERFVAFTFGFVQLANYLLLLAIWRYGLRHLVISRPSPKVVWGMAARLMMAIGINVVAVFLAPWSERLATAAFICTPLIFIRDDTVDTPGI